MIIGKKTDLWNILSLVPWKSKESPQQKPTLVGIGPKSLTINDFEILKPISRGAFG